LCFDGDRAERECEGEAEVVEDRERRAARVVNVERNMAGGVSIVVYLRNPG
jgi:hypothetical protein